MIDWEYAGLGDPYFDLAIVIQHHGLGPDLASHFLHCYLEREPLAAESRRLQDWCSVYAALLDLWTLRVS